MNIEQQINSLLAHLANNSIPPTGMLFYESFTKLQLDFSSQSIDKLDTLLTQLAAKAKEHPAFSLKELVKRHGGSTFFISLAAYLGSYIIKKANTLLVNTNPDAKVPLTTQWLWRIEDNNIFQSIANIHNQQSLNHNAQALVLQLKSGSAIECFPLLAVFRKLLHAAENKYSLSKYVSQTLAKLNSTTHQAAEASPANTPVYAIENTKSNINTLQVKQQKPAALATQKTTETITENAAKTGDVTQLARKNQTNHQNTNDHKNQKSLSPELYLQLQQQLQQNKNSIASSSSDFDEKIKRFVIVAIALLLVAIILTAIV